jgi:hypothetical protein
MTGETPVSEMPAPADPAVWHLVTVVGNEHTLRGFLAAFSSLSGPGALLDHDLDIAPAGLTERVHDLLTAHHRVVAPAALATALVAALHKTGPDSLLRIHELHRIAGASLKVEARVYNHAIAAAVRSELLQGLPPGVRIADLQVHEQDLPGDHTPGPYDPVHDYELVVEGQYWGPLAGVLEMRRRAAVFEQVSVGQVTLVLEELPLP